MVEFLKSIQEKPKHVRVRIFIIVMVVVAVVLFFMWLSLSVDGVSNNTKTKNNYIVKDLNLPTISESVSANLKDIFNIENKK